MTANPLLARSAEDDLPAFDQIRPEHAEPAIDTVLANNRAALKAVIREAEGAAATPTWQNLIEPVEEMSERLARAWGPVTHLFAVTSTPAWRAAHAVCLPKVTGYQVELSQHEGLFRAYRRMAQDSGFAWQPPARQKVVRDALRDFRLAGVELSGEARARFRRIALRLSAIESTFQENVMDSAQAWGKQVTQEQALSGMVPQARRAAQAKAKAKGLEGYWLTLDFPSYDAVLTRADDRLLRRELYEAYLTRASDQGPLAGRFDNGPLMIEMLALRAEQARLLGFPSYADVSLQTKMASSPEEVERFLVDLASRARVAALAELGEARDLARRRDGVTELQPWDLAYYTDKLKEERLGFSDEDLRPYFEITGVLDGVFSLVDRLYGIRVEKVAGIPTWHSDVQVYRLRESAGEPIGLFYFDPYARPDKRGGAWMDECRSRRIRQGAVQQPAAYLTCNFAPPLPGQPCLLAHKEVVTLFHELGHGLHHLLTQIDEQAVSGIRGVEWDAVELPSQLMENWCFDTSTLRQMARHWRTGRPMPDELIDKLKASRSFFAGLATLRQIEFSLFDLRVHHEVDIGSLNDLLSVLAQVQTQVSVLTPPSWTRMPNSFSHIFGGGYAAGYYSYKWAEVLSADVFSAFEESRFSPETGRSFRQRFLSQGGARPALDLFCSFRGRPPSTQAFLRQYGFDRSPPSAPLGT